MSCPLLNRIPSSVISDAVEKRGHLILDISNEAPIADPKYFKAIHNSLDHFKISPEQVFLLSQNRSLGWGYNNYCATLGIANRINIDFYHSFAKAFLVEAYQRIRHSRKLIRRLAALEAGDIPEYSRVFLSQNYTPRPLRVWFVCWLLQNQMLSSGYVSLGIGGAKGEHWVDAYTKIPQWLSTINDASQSYERLCDILPLSIDDLSSYNGIPTSISAQTLDAHLDSSLQIVVETECTKGSRDRITEKSFKPLLSMQAAIILGNPMSLAWLRQFGFKTWAESLNEEYDLIQSPSKRIALALESILAYVNADPASRRSLYSRSLPSIIHNFKWLMNGAIDHYQNIYEIPLYLRMLRLIE